MKGQKLDAPAADVAIGMEKLRLLHQQVLPFILRREKEHVLKELPPKIVTRIPCELSPIQKHLYAQFCSGDLAKKSLSIFQSLVESMGDISGQKDGKKSSSSVNPEILKTLLYLRLVCTHPWLVRGKEESDVALRDMKSVGLEMSGKLLALVTLLCEAGVVTSLLTAADNDSSLIYCDDIDGGSDDVNDDIHEVLEGEGGIDASLSTGIDSTITNSGSSRCLIFAQFTHSLDVVEELVLKRHMPSVKFLRLDGRVPASKRSDIVDLFNEDESFKILLLTTRIGGLGLNLTGADTVIFLEMDWNPFSDLQAADRAHRIGQTKSVRVYQLVTTDTIEEKTMKLHEKKLAMSSAIVNTDNSSMYSLGTDKLLDIFQYRCDGGVTSGGVPTTAGIESALDAMVERYQDEYQSLSLDDFLSGFQPTGGGKANSA
jgi:TATA-binding protein-associated factor